MNEIKLKDIEILRLKDGDILVVKSEHTLTKRAVDSILEGIKSEIYRVLPGLRISVFVLDEGMDMEVLRKEA